MSICWWHAGLQYCTHWYWQVLAPMPANSYANIGQKEEWDPRPSTDVTPRWRASSSVLRLLVMPLLVLHLKQLPDHLRLRLRLRSFVFVELVLVPDCLPCLQLVLSSCNDAEREHTLSGCFSLFLAVGSSLQGMYNTHNQHVSDRFLATVGDRVRVRVRG